MYNNSRQPVTDLWAITTSNGEIVWSRGGSSSSPKIMVYESEKKAQAAIRNSWTKQVHGEDEVEIRKIYSTT